MPGKLNRRPVPPSATFIAVAGPDDVSSPVAGSALTPRADSRIQLVITSRDDGCTRLGRSLTRYGRYSALLRQEGVFVGHGVPHFWCHADGAKGPDQLRSSRVARGVPPSARSFDASVQLARRTRGSVKAPAALVKALQASAYTVVRRTREIGIRIALGATSGQILALILRRGMALILPGVGTGIIGSLALRKVIYPTLTTIIVASSNGSRVPRILGEHGLDARERDRRRRRRRRAGSPAAPRRTSPPLRSRPRRSRRCRRRASRRRASWTRASA